MQTGGGTTGTDVDGEDVTPPTGPGRGHLPTTRRGSQSRAAILEATLELLELVGYQRLTMEAVAKRAGASKATIYRWWATRSALVMAAVGNGIDVPSSEMTGDTRTDIRALVEHIATTLGEGTLGRALPGLAADLSDNPGESAELASLLGPQRAANSAVILAAAGRGDLPHDVDARLVLDMIAGAVLYRRLVQQPVDDVVVEQLATAIAGGHLPRTPPHPTS